jgi:hypothetical protein
MSPSKLHVTYHGPPSSASRLELVRCREALLLFPTLVFPQKHADGARIIDIIDVLVETAASKTANNDDL